MVPVHALVCVLNESSLDSTLDNSLALGTWDWSALSVTGGSAGEIVNFSGIEGFSQ